MKNILPSDIVKEWGLGSLPYEKQLEMVERIGSIIYQALLVRSLDILSEKNRRSLMDCRSRLYYSRWCFRFSTKKIPNFEKIVLEERKSWKRTTYFLQFSYLTILIILSNIVLPFRSFLFWKEETFKFPEFSSLERWVFGISKLQFALLTTTTRFQI